MTTKNGRMTIIQEIVKINWNIILLLSFIYADYKAKANDYLAQQKLSSVDYKCMTVICAFYCCNRLQGWIIV